MIGRHYVSIFQKIDERIFYPALNFSGAEHIFGALSSRGRRVTWLDLSKTRITSKGLNKISESMSRSPHVFSSLQTLILGGLNSGNKGDDLQVRPNISDETLS